MNRELENALVLALIGSNLTNREYIRQRIALVKADTRLSKGERHKIIEDWCQYLPGSGSQYLGKLAS